MQSYCVSCSSCAHTSLSFLGLLYSPESTGHGLVIALPQNAVARGENVGDIARDRFILCC